MFNRLLDRSLPVQKNALPQNAEELFDAYGERVHRFCLRLCAGHAAEAEDLAQDVLLLAWRARGTFEGRSSALTYLYRIAINRLQRARTQAAAATAREQYAAPHPPTADLADRTALRLDIEQALAMLPDNLRVAFLVVKVEGLTYREAAGVLEIPQGTVQSRVHEATLRLRSLLTNDDACAAGGVPMRSASNSRKEKCNAV